MVYIYGMALMQHRTTFALDEATISRLKLLARAWKVSQAEVVRRSVEQADRAAREAARGPLDKLNTYHLSGGLNKEVGMAYLEEVAENRADWSRDS